MTNAQKIAGGLGVAGILLIGGIAGYFFSPRGAPLDTTNGNGTVTAPPDKSDLIFVTSPKPNTTVTSPLTVTGEARGNWYFEASFPVRLIDKDGHVLASTPAQAQGEWMTQNFVPFRAELTFTNAKEIQGFLVLQKDNPSGLPEHDDELRIPVTIGVTSAGVQLNREGAL